MPEVDKLVNIASFAGPAGFWDVGVFDAKHETCYVRPGPGQGHFRAFFSAHKGMGSDTTAVRLTHRVATRTLLPS
jgi:hypothetical protein